MTAAWDAENYARNFNFVPEYGRELIDILVPKAGEKILDLGCGTGQLTNELHKHGVDVTGVDRDANMLALAKKSYPAINFVQQGGEDLDLNITFDAVFSNAALHWMDVGKVFPRVAKVLRPGGRIAAEMGGINNIITIERAIINSLKKIGAPTMQTPWRFPSPATVAQKLESSGFEVRYTNLYDRPTHLPDESGGLKGWVKMFGAAFLKAIPEDQHEKLLQLIEDECRPTLYKDGKWYGDYRRFHFVAVKL